MDKAVKYSETFEIILTSDGKTLVRIFPRGPQEPECQWALAERFADWLGNPEGFKFIGPEPQTLLVLFSGQDLPEPLKDYAERQTSRVLLECLEIGKPLFTP